MIIHMSDMEGKILFFLEECQYIQKTKTVRSAGNTYDKRVSCVPELELVDGV